MMWNSLGMSGMWLSWPLLVVGLALLGFVLLRGLTRGRTGSARPVRSFSTALPRNGEDQYAVGSGRQQTRH
jgi:hypothetical protein